MFEVVKAIREATDGFEEVGSGFQCLDASGVEGECPVAIGNGVSGAAGGAEGRGAVEEALGEEGLWGRAAAVEDLCKEADGLGGEASLEGGDGGGAAAKEELHVTKEGGGGVGFRGGGRKDWKIVE